MKKWMGMVLALFLPTGAIAASSYSRTVANEAGLAYDNTYTLDLEAVDAKTASAQAVYSSATYTSKSFTGGTVSTGSITVVTPSALAGVASSNTVRILTNSLPAKAEINLNGRSLTRGVNWATGSTSSATAINIKNAVNAIAGFSASTPTLTSVAIVCTKAGAACNAYTLSVNTSSMTVPQSHFTGGVNPGIVGINGITFTEGVNWTTQATAALTAKAISDAIMASPAASAIVSTTWTAAGVVTATSTAVGAASNYRLYTSTQAALQISGTVTTPTGFAGRGESYMTGGSNAGWTRNSKVITVVGHGFPTALPVLFRGTPAIGGLTTETTYYVVPLSANTLGLASSKANAVAGTYITLTSSQTATSANTYSLIPAPILGTPSFKWQVSNDGSSWTDLSVSSVTMTSYTLGGASSAWDFGTPAYRYFRVNVIAPTQGAISLVVQAAGRTSRR